MARGKKHAATQVIDAEFVEIVDPNEARVVDEARVADTVSDVVSGAVNSAVNGATGVGRSILEDLGFGNARVVWNGVGATGTIVPTASSTITMSFGAAAGVAAGVAIVAGAAGWYLRGRAARRGK
jgi:hypothetical protein